MHFENKFEFVVDHPTTDVDVKFDEVWSINKKVLDMTPFFVQKQYGRLNHAIFVQFEKKFELVVDHPTIDVDDKYDEAWSINKEDTDMTSLRDGITELQNYGITELRNYGITELRTEVKT